MEFKWTWYCTLLFNIFNVAIAEWNSNDYMKREHSLVRPYQGRNLFSIFLFNCQNKAR